MGDDLLGIGKAASAISQPLQDFLHKLLGPAAEEAGELFADRVRYLRWKNSLHIVEQANKLLEAKGVTPQTIPLKTLVPILEGASLEGDDDNLEGKWVNLIANAASGEKVNSRHAEILRQLSPLDALILDELTEINKNRVSVGDPLLKYTPGRVKNKTSYMRGNYAETITLYLNNDKGKKFDYLEVAESLFCLSRLGLLNTFIVKAPEEFIGEPLTVLAEAFMQTVREI